MHRGVIRALVLSRASVLKAMGRPHITHIQHKWNQYHLQQWGHADIVNCGQQNSNTVNHYTVCEGAKKIIF